MKDGKPIYLTFDLETDNYTKHKRKASPFDDRNYIVQSGWSVNGGKPQEKYFKRWHRDPVLPYDIIKQMGKGDLFIGFNIKFDMLWVWEDPEVQAALKRGAEIYCGQYAEYLMAGQVEESHFTAMNDIATKYGGGCKVDAVKEMWEDGYLTSQIPRGLLTDYLIGDGDQIVGDVHNTWLIFKGQIKRMRQEHPKAFRRMLRFRMDGLLALCEMEYNGAHVDAKLGEELRQEQLRKLAVATEELNSHIPKLPPEFEFKWTSNVHKSCIIFGGHAKYEKWVQHTDDEGNLLYAKKTEKWPLFNNEPFPLTMVKKAGAYYVLEVAEGTPRAIKHKDKFLLVQDRFASGKRQGEGKTKNIQVPDMDKPKGAKQEFHVHFKQKVKPKASWVGANVDARGGPLYSVGAKVMEELELLGLPFTDALSKRGKIDKELGIYYMKEDPKGNKGMLTLLDDNGVIHTKLNNVNTVTGRLSASDPPLQTIPRNDKDKDGAAKSEVKRMFTSRFGKKGRMAEIDYSQLEVVVQGVLSGDDNLCQDLRDKVDFHCKRLSAKRNETYEHVVHMAKVVEDPIYKKERTGAKIFSFQRAYGAGASTIAASTKMPREEVDALIVAEEKLYPGVVKFDQMLEQAIKANRRRTEHKLFIGNVPYTKGESYWDSPTGTRYMWRENITPEFMHKKGKYTGFSPTERKNYPVQGFGGEIVQTMVGLVWRYMIENDRFGGNVLLCNTVHDCIWLDGHEDIIKEVALKCQEILESVPETFNNAYEDINITVPFPCETEIGKDMFDMHTVH